MPFTDRHFSDDQTRKLLKKAAELQRKRGTSPGTMGLSLEEIQHIAEESGIDPSYVLEALITLDDFDDEEDGFHFWGAPLEIDYQRTFKGEVPADKLEEKFIPLIREAMGVKGNYERLGNTLSFTHDANKDPVGLEVSIVSQNGETNVRVKPRIWDWTFVFFLLPSFISGAFSLIFTSKMDWSAGFGWSLFGVLAVLIFFLGRMGFKRFGKDRRKRAKRLLHDMAEVVREYAQAHEATSGAQPAGSPQISMPGEVFEESAGTRTGQRSKTSS